MRCESMRGSEVSQAVQDPIVALAVDVVVTALLDLLSNDILHSFDALCWWISEEDGPTWINLLELGDSEPDRLFANVLKVRDGKTKTALARFIEQRN